MEEEIKETDRIENECNVLLLRHGESLANQIYNQIVGTDNYFCDVGVHIDFDKEFRDVRLSDTGKEQCIKAKEGLKEMNIHSILMSPLRRAIETAYYIF